MTPIRAESVTAESPTPRSVLADDSAQDIPAKMIGAKRILAEATRLPGVRTQALHDHWRAGSLGASIAARPSPPGQ